MRSLPTTLLVLALLAPLASAALTIQGPPAATPGDYADMRGEIPFPGGGSSVIITHTVVVGPEQITLNGTTYDAIKSTEHTQAWINATLNGQAFNRASASDSTFWVRASDRASLRTNATPESGAASQTDYDPPCASFQYPLSVGAHWTAECPYRITTNGQTTTGTQTVNYTVVREERITVPAGTFDTLLLENATSAGGTIDSWFAPDACTFARIQSTTPQGNVTFDLTGYKCAAAGGSGGSTPTPAGTTPAGTTPASTTPASSTPAGATTPASSTPATTATTSSGGKAPGPGVALVVAGAGLLALALRRRR